MGRGDTDPIPVNFIYTIANALLMLFIVAAQSISPVPK